MVGADLTPPNEETMTPKQIDKLIKALEFYADPDTYFAIGFRSDPPCGDFMGDFSRVGEGVWATYKPGKLARAALKAVKERP